jgi:hypothetical protein
MTTFPFILILPIEDGAGFFGRSPLQGFDVELDHLHHGPGHHRARPARGALAVAGDLRILEFLKTGVKIEQLLRPDL